MIDAHDAPRPKSNRRFDWQGIADLLSRLDTLYIWVVFVVVVIFLVYTILSSINVVIFDGLFIVGIVAFVDIRRKQAASYSMAPSTTPCSSRPSSTDAHEQ